MTNIPPLGFLPYGRQSIDDDDIAAVVGVLRSGWLTQGPAVEAFERALALRVGAPHAVACATGTAALHLALLGLGIGPGDAAIVPSITFLATASAVRLTGAEVVFADVDPGTALMTAATAAEAVARARRQGWHPRVLMSVDFAGQAAVTSDLVALAAAEGMAVVEDACHAIGTRTPTGSVGSLEGVVATAFSFHPVKTIAAGEGGAVTTPDAGLAAAMRRWRNHGIERDPGAFTDRDAAFDPAGEANPWYYEMAEPGFNYRLSDLQCALATSQLGRLDAFVARRQALMDAYARCLAPLAPRVRLLDRLAGDRPAWHLCVALLDVAAIGRSRAAVMNGLRQQGIGTQVHYIPVHRQPYYRHRYGALDLPGAEAYYAGALSLPLFPDMDDGDVERVAAAVAAETA